MPTVAVNYPWYSYENTLSIHIIYTTKYSSANTAQSNIRKIDMSQLQIQLVNLCVLLVQVDLPHVLPCTRSEERQKQKTLTKPTASWVQKDFTYWVHSWITIKQNQLNEAIYFLHLFAHDISYIYTYNNPINMFSLNHHPKNQGSKSFGFFSIISNRTDPTAHCPA